MTDTASHEMPAAEAPFIPPQIRMDRSRPFATVHGDRGPGDPHAGVHFYQDGLPHDAQGFLIFDEHMYEGNDKDSRQRREKLQAKLKKYLAAQAKRKTAAPTPRDAEQLDGDDRDIETKSDQDGEESRSGEDDEEDDREPINLSAWCRGEQQVEWQEMTQHIARIYKKRVASVADAIPFLVSEGVCPPGEVAKKFKKYLN